MRILLEFNGATVAELGFFKLTDPPRIIEYAGELFVLARPIVAFHGKSREVVGYGYQLERPVKMTTLDRMVDPCVMGGGS